MFKLQYNKDSCLSGSTKIDAYALVPVEDQSPPPDRSRKRSYFCKGSDQVN